MGQRRAGPRPRAPAAVERPQLPGNRPRGRGQPHDCAQTPARPAARATGHPPAHPHRPGKQAAGHQRWHPEAGGGKTECGRDTASAASPDRYGPPSGIPGPPAGHGPAHIVGRRLRNDRYRKPRHARGGPPPVRTNVGPTPTGTHPARVQGSGRRAPTGRAVGLAYADGPR
jgi:hypothetical protein